MFGLLLMGVCAQAPSAPKLTHVAQSVSGGRVTGLDDEWDLGPRPLRAVRLGELAQTEGLIRKARSATLRVSFRALGRDRAKATVVLCAVYEDGKATTTTTSDIRVEGGLAAVERPTPSPAAGGEIVLLRWRNRTAKRSLTVTYR